MPGPKRRSEFDRYEGAGCEPAIYLIEVGDLVKVGKSIRPNHRMRALHSLHTTKGGVDLGRYATFRFDGRLWDAEKRCIDALARVAVNPPPCKEYFAGISFDEAVSVVRQAL